MKANITLEMSPAAQLITVMLMIIAALFTFDATRAGKAKRTSAILAAGRQHTAGTSRMHTMPTQMPTADDFNNDVRDEIYGRPSAFGGKQ